MARQILCVSQRGTKRADPNRQRDGGASESESGCRGGMHAGARCALGAIEAVCVRACVRVCAHGPPSASGVARPGIAARCVGARRRSGGGAPPALLVVRRAPHSRRRGVAQRSGRGRRDYPEVRTSRVFLQVIHIGRCTTTQVRGGERQKVVT